VHELEAVPRLASVLQFVKLSRRPLATRTPGAEGLSGAKTSAGLVPHFEAAVDEVDGAADARATEVQVARAAAVR
jgi:hypothetical protein